jgi:hypothetical protein
VNRFVRWYGANPLHLLALLASFALAGYAAARLVASHPFGVAFWFLGAVIGHDLLLMPLYSLADKSALAAIRHRAPRWPVVRWINYLRVPAGLSGLLLLVWFPLILRLHTDYHASTTLSADPFLWHWLAVTGALFLLSAALLALRLRRMPYPAAAPPTSSRGRSVRPSSAGVPGPVPPRATRLPPRMSGPDVDEPAAGRLLPPQPDAAENDSDEHAADPGTRNPPLRSQAASPADQGDLRATGGAPGQDQETRDPGL